MSGLLKAFNKVQQSLSDTKTVHLELDYVSLQLECCKIYFHSPVWPGKLVMSNLTRLNIDSSVLNWATSFLANCSQFIFCNGTNLYSVLFRFCFRSSSIFILLLSNLAPNSSSLTKLFADDSIIYCKITMNYDIDILQPGPHSICKWCDTWQMELNISKCQYQISGQKYPVESH